MAVHTTITRPQISEYDQLLLQLCIYFVCSIYCFVVS
jgi:hypothetical protein